LACISRGLTPKNTAFVAKVSEKLVYKYVNLVLENQVDIEKQKMLNREVDYDDIPF